MDGDETPDQGYAAGSSGLALPGIYAEVIALAERMLGPVWNGLHGFGDLPGVASRRGWFEARDVPRDDGRRVVGQQVWALALAAPRRLRISLGSVGGHCGGAEPEHRREGS